MSELNLKKNKKKRKIRLMVHVERKWNRLLNCESDPMRATSYGYRQSHLSISLHQPRPVLTYTFIPLSLPPFGKSSHAPASTLLTMVPLPSPFTTRYSLLDYFFHVTNPFHPHVIFISPPLSLCPVPQRVLYFNFFPLIVFLNKNLHNMIMP